MEASTKVEQIGRKSTTRVSQSADWKKLQKLTSSVGTSSSEYAQPLCSSEVTFKQVVIGEIHRC